MMNKFHKPLHQVAFKHVLKQHFTKVAPAVHPVKIGRPSEEIFSKEEKYGAHNYQPLPVAIHRGKGRQDEHFSKCFQVLFIQNIDRKCLQIVICALVR